jgi:predicted Ser/Thr protein kinase
MRGGLIKKINDEPIRIQTYRILSKSTVEYLSRGRFGFVFKVTYHDEEHSGFVDEKDHEVRIFILKAQGIDMRMKRITDPEPVKPEDEYDSHEDGLFPYSSIVHWDDVVREAMLQQQIYERALDKELMPPCPAILFYGSITAEEFERHTKVNLVYKSRLEKDPINSRDLKAYRMAIILMEYVHGKDLVAIPDEIYLPRAQELINKAFRTYVTALKCGVLQGDPQAQNFLLSGDDVTLIDFGSAQKLMKIESDALEPMIQKAEDETQGEHRSRPLIQKLLRMEPADEDYKTLEKWLLRPQLSATNKLLGPTLTTLLPSIKLDDTIVEQCKAGLCKPRSTLTDRETLSAETIAENKRYAAHKLRRDMELNDRVKRAEDETYELRMYRENDLKRHRAGGKRRTKYVGNRKRFGTRRKVQNRSF